MPDPQRPSSAPLSESEADRLSERFTASWDDPDLGAEPVTGSSPAAASSPSSASPSSASSPPPAAAEIPTAPLPAVTPAGKPKRTLLGIAPIVIGPSAPPPAPPAPLPAPAKPQAVAAAATPLPGVGPSSLGSSPAAASRPPAARASEPAISAPPPSSPESSVTRGLTTPSKPYIPKDDPSTPAVVISDTPPATPASHDRARIAQTMPGETRSSPVAAPQPLAPPVAADAALDETYPPLRSRSKLPFVLGGLALLGAAALLATRINSSEGPIERASSETERISATAAAPPPPPAPTATPTPEALTPGVAPPAASTAPAAEPRRAVAPTAAEPKSTGKAPPKKAVTALPAPRKATKTETKSESKPSAAEPAAKKGVIVRETPF